MGKKSKNTQKNVQTSEPQQKKFDMTKINQIKEKIAQLKTQKKYDETLLAIIDLFNLGYTEPAFLYEVAEIYYITGDYERAVIWSKKTLSFENDHEPALMLLAKLYALEDEMHKCFDLIEQLLANSSHPDAETITQIADLLDYFEDDYDETDFENDHQLLWQFKQKLANGTVIIEEADENQCLPKTTSACSPAAEQSQLQEPAAIDDSFACLKTKPIDEIIATIMNQPSSLMEKIDTCLYFSVYYYSQKNIASTLMLLKQAILIDGHNDLVLKNIGFVLAEMEEKQGALEFLTKVKEKDLMVLKQIELLTQA